MANSDFSLSITVEKKPYMIHVKKRPGVEQFLQRMSEFYELVIYTASLAEYADPVCDLIDPNKLVSERLFRASCTPYQGVLVKDLSRVGRNLKDVLIVDNSENSFLFQPENAIQISNFFTDDKDRELSRLIPFLYFLSLVHDVRATKGWMEKYLTQDFIEYKNMDGEHEQFNKNLFLRKQRSLIKAADGSNIPFIQSKEFQSGNSLSMTKDICEEEEEQQVEVKQVIPVIIQAAVDSSKDKSQSKKSYKKDLVIQVPLDSREALEVKQIRKTKRSEDGEDDNEDIENTEELKAQLLEEQLSLKLSSKAESTRKLLESRSNEASEELYFCHKPHSSQNPEESSLKMNKRGKNTKMIGNQLQQLLSNQQQKIEAESDEIKVYPLSEGKANEKINDNQEDEEQAEEEEEKIEFEQIRFDPGLFNLNSPVAGTISLSGIGKDNRVTADYDHESAKAECLSKVQENSNNEEIILDRNHKFSNEVKED